MTILFQSHSGREKEKGAGPSAALAAPPTGTDIAVDEQADFGYFVPPLDAPENYLPLSAATVGELDTDQLFYLRSRGIPDAEARSILVRAFLAEALDAVSNETVRQVLDQAVEGWWEKQAA